MEDGEVGEHGESLSSGTFHILPNPVVYTTSFRTFAARFSKSDHMSELFKTCPITLRRSCLGLCHCSSCTLNGIQTSYHSCKELGCLAPACFSKLNKYAVITYSVCRAQWSAS